MDIKMSAGILPPAIRRSIIPIISGLGRTESGALLSQGLNELAKVDRAYAFERKGWTKPQLYSAWTRQGHLEAIIQDYTERYYKNDPMNSVIKRGAFEPIAMMRLKYDEVPDPEYRRACFDEPGMCERVTIMIRSDDRWRVLNVHRSFETGYFNRVELQHLMTFAEIVLPLIGRSEELRCAAGQAESGQASVSDLEARFCQRFPELTHRERQVCARTMMGMTAEAIALDLAIGRASVLTYRQRGYKRLNICSGYQLAGLILN